MDDGKRLACNAKFLELLPEHSATILADRGYTFRLAVRTYMINEFSCTDGSASTHYNHAKLAWTEANPELAVSLGLGRKEGTNNGGRPKKNAAETVAEVEAPAAGVVAPVAEQAAAVEEKLYNVMKAKSGELVLLGVSLEVAEAAIAKAAKGKKAALVMA
jgi:hypothetical protein